MAVKRSMRRVECSYPYCRSSPCCSEWVGETRSRQAVLSEVSTSIFVVVNGSRSVDDEVLLVAKETSGLYRIVAGFDASVLRPGEDAEGDFAP